MDTTRSLPQRVISRVFTCLFLLALTSWTNSSRADESILFSNRVKDAMPDSFPGWCVLLIVTCLAVGLAVAVIGAIRNGIRRRRNRRAVVVRLSSTRCSLDPTTCSIELAPDNREIFSTFATRPDRLYQLNIIGWSRITRRTEYVYPEKRTWNHHFSIDALYEQDSAGNFTQAHLAKGNGLHIDGKPLTSIAHETIIADRDSHEYEFVLDGTGEKMSFSFRMETYSYSQRLEVWFSECPERFPTLASLASLAAERKAAEELAEAVEALSTHSELDRNWADPAFVEASAKTGGRALLESRPDLQKRLSDFHENKKLMAHLREHHPDLLRRLTGPIDGYLMAQRIAVNPPPAPVPKLRRKRTPAEFRDHLVRGAEILAEDERAMLDAGAAAYERKAQTLRDRGLDEDEITNVLGSLAEVLQEIKERVAARKGAADVEIAKVG